MRSRGASVDRHPEDDPVSLLLSPSSLLSACLFYCSPSVLFFPLFFRPFFWAFLFLNHDERGYSDGGFLKPVNGEMNEEQSVKKKVNGRAEGARRYRLSTFVGLRSV